jgi:hypothetical protein
MTSPPSQIEQGAGAHKNQNQGPLSNRAAHDSSWRRHRTISWMARTKWHVTTHPRAPPFLRRVAPDDVSNPHNAEGLGPLRSKLHTTDLGHLRLFDSCVGCNKPRSRARARRRRTHSRPMFKRNDPLPASSARVRYASGLGFERFPCKYRPLWSSCVAAAGCQQDCHSTRRPDRPLSLLCSLSLSRASRFLPHARRTRARLARSK